MNQASNEAGKMKEAHELSPAWSDEHDDAAAREGWGIWDSAGSVNGRWQVQRVDDVAEFAQAAGFESMVFAWKINPTGWRDD